MNRNLKRIIATAMVAGFAVFGTACSSNSQEPAQPEYVTYEFETFDGTKVVIDENNIISQQEDKNALESKLVPADAEVIAPGRDYVYLEDDTCYYVEDTTNNLVTIAAKDAVVNGDPNVVAFGGEGYSLTYNPEAITLFPDDENRSVTLSYTREGVEMAGSNVMTFTVVDDATAEGVLQEQAASYGETAEVTEVSLNDNVPAFEFTMEGESEGSDLKTVQTYYGIQQGDKVIMIDTFRTVDPNEDVQADIDQEFDNVFQSIALD